MAENDPPPPQNITISSLSDLLPESFRGDGTQDTEEFFSNFITWVDYHNKTFTDNQLKVGAIRYCLSSDAKIWWDDRLAESRRVVNPVALPATLDALQVLFYTKYRIVKSKRQLRSEVATLKYEPGVSPIPLKNKFVAIARKLELSQDVQIEKFLSLLPPQLKLFVANPRPNNLDEICTRICDYQNIIETDELAMNFSQSVTFAENVCKICDGIHKTVSCPDLKSMMQGEIVSHQHNSRQSRSRERSKSPQYQRGRSGRGRYSSRSPYRRGGYSNNFNQDRSRNRNRGFRSRGRQFRGRSRGFQSYQSRPFHRNRYGQQYYNSDEMNDFSQISSFTTVSGETFKRVNKDFQQASH